MAKGSLLRAIINLVGFAIGLGLFLWIVIRALEGGDWSRLAEASPWLLGGLLGSTVLSLVANGMTFWVTVRPVRPLGFLDLQLLNLVANMLNYAPFRLGAIARVAYHLRVDRLGFVQLGIWFTMIGYVLALGLGSCVLATLVRDRIDWGWGALVAGQMVLGGLVTRAVVGQSLIARYGQGIDLMFNHDGALWGAVVLRLVDIAAFTGRMAAALAILDLHFPADDVVILALVALAASLIPFGRLGFREVCVVAAAHRLGEAGGAGAVPWEQLALVESAGEALIYVPAGGLALLWYRKRWKAA